MKGRLLYTEQEYKKDNLALVPVSKKASACAADEVSGMHMLPKKL
jgi:hypothetical protein